MTQIEEQIKIKGFKQYGFAPLQPALSLDLYKNWLEKGFHGEMKYLETHLAQKEQPQLYAPKAHSAIVIAQDYFPTIPGHEEFPLRTNAIASYARGKDYHFWFTQALKELALTLQSLFPKEQFYPCSDSAPVLERDLAYRGGLGWIGKNTCVIDRHHGSFFFIGEILTSLKLTAALSLTPDHCGTCTRCIDACPTQALVSPRELDARKCISYWTIESRENPPLALRSKIGDWLFGCDICQSVCPWNKKVFGARLTETKESQDLLELQDREKELGYILRTSNRQLMRDLRLTPLIRAGGTGLKRNAIVVATNLKLRGLVPDIQVFLNHPKLRPLATWSLHQLTNPDL
jgi:epoxyqueuosine reductase